MKKDVTHIMSCQQAVLGQMSNVFHFAISIIDYERNLVGQNSPKHTSSTYWTYTAEYGICTYYESALAHRPYLQHRRKSVPEVRTYKSPLRFAICSKPMYLCPNNLSRQELMMSGCTSNRSSERNFQSGMKPPCPLWHCPGRKILSIITRGPSGPGVDTGDR